MFRYKAGLKQKMLQRLVAGFRIRKSMDADVINKNKKKG